MSDKVSTEQIVGISAVFRKTVSESDVYQFAGITGDFDPLHIDADYCERETEFGQRIAHGALVVGFMMAAAALAGRRIDGVLVSLGLDRLRHIAPVYFGDTLQTTYTFHSYDPIARRGLADLVVINQKGSITAIATHVFKAMPKVAKA